MGLGVRPEPDAMLSGVVGHRLDVPLQDVEIDDERRRIELGDEHGPSLPPGPRGCAPEGYQGPADRLRRADGGVGRRSQGALSQRCPVHDGWQRVVVALLALVEVEAERQVLSVPAIRQQTAHDRQTFSFSLQYGDDVRGLRVPEVVVHAHTSPS